MKVKARAIDGKANEAVIGFVAEYFGVPRSCVRINRGASAREKTLFIESASAGVLKKLEELTEAVAES